MNRFYGEASTKFENLNTWSNFDELEAPQRRSKHGTNNVN